MYDSNSGVKFPLVDDHEEDIPNDVLLDLSITVPEGEDVNMTNLVVTEKYAFCSFETSSGNLVGHVMALKPRPFRVYPLEMGLDGAGWLVFGSGVRRELSVVGASVAVDPKTVVETFENPSNWSLEVNGTMYPMPSFLTIRGAGYLASGERGGKLALTRNDVGLLEDEVKTLFARQVAAERLIQTINQIKPDANGEMRLEFKDDGDGAAGVAGVVRRASDEKAVGVIINTSGLVEGCVYVDVDDLLECSTGKGPLDVVACPEEVCSE